jgi:hypothetical protein
MRQIQTIAIVATSKNDPGTRRYERDMTERQEHDPYGRELERRRLLEEWEEQKRREAEQ